MTRILPRLSRRSLRLIAREAKQDAYSVAEWLAMPPNTSATDRTIIRACQWLCVVAFAATAALTWAAPWE